MRLGPIGLLSASAALLAGSLFVANNVSVAQDSATIIKDRQEVMKENGNAMKTIGGFVQAGVGTMDDVAAAAGTIAQNAMGIADLFPAGTSMDDVSDPENGAKPVIWEKWDVFIGDADTLELEALKLKEYADQGDAEAVAAQFAVLGTEGCGGCHETFRQKLD